MTILEEARKSIPSTDGVKDLQKFFDLGDKYNARIPNVHTVDFQLLVLAKLEGKAYELCRNLEEINWDNIKRALEDSFSDKKSISLLNIELANCFQKENESVAEFGNRVKTIIRKLSKAYKEQDANILYYDTEAPALSAFEDGLIDPNMRILIKSNCVSLDDALKVATIEENRKKNKYEKNIISHVNLTNNCTYCGESNHNQHFCMKFKKENHICKKCDRVGHFPSECPRKNESKIFQDRPHFDNNYRYNFNNPQRMNNRPQSMNNNYRHTFNNPQSNNNNFQNTNNSYGFSHNNPQNTNYRNNYNSPQNTPQNNNYGNFSPNQNRFSNQRNAFQNNFDRSAPNNRFDHQNRFNNNRNTGNYYNNRQNPHTQSNGAHERITVINPGNGNTLEAPVPSRN
jgi:hypothetical protein